MINFYCFWKKQCLCFFRNRLLIALHRQFWNWGEGKFNGPSNGVNRLEIYDWIFLLNFFSVLFCFITQNAKEWISNFLAEIENKTFISQMKLFNLAADVMNENVLVLFLFPLWRLCLRVCQFLSIYFIWIHSTSYISDSVKLFNSKLCPPLSKNFNNSRKLKSTP